MSVNKVILIGNVGKPPELRYVPNGDAVATFSIATSEKFKGRDGQAQEITTWHNIVAWRKLAEIVSQYLVKGKQVYLEGKIQNRSYDDRDGVKKYISEIVIDQLQMLDSKGDGGQRQERSTRPAESGNATAAAGSYKEEPFDPNDEVPF